MVKIEIQFLICLEQSYNFVNLEEEEVAAAIAFFKSFCKDFLLPKTTYQQKIRILSFRTGIRNLNRSNLNAGNYKI